MEFPAGDGNSSIDLKDYNTHVIGGVLLQWLQELPEPLLGFEFYENLLAALGMCGGAAPYTACASCASCAS